MAIRFDKDYRRPTNGPMIFFSDSASEGAFAEEIRGALLSGLSFYGYRLPESPMISFGSSEGYIEGIGVPGFVIGMFDPTIPFITIPYKGCNSKNDISRYVMPSESTSFYEYSLEVSEIIKSLQNHPNGKIVATRVKVKENLLDIAETFFNFCQRFPHSYIFCFSTSATGCWIGASPELLLESHEGILSTMSLAGTRHVSDRSVWDDKNIEEQKIVTDYILNSFENAGLSPIIKDSFSKQSGSIEHICTPVSAMINPSLFDVETFLKQFSPTPALCGAPKTFALETIKRLEKFERGCYGGFCGPFHSMHDFTFNVILRCASIAENRFCIYAGGGITAKSSINNEWEETESKIESTFS